MNHQIVQPTLEIPTHIVAKKADDYQVNDSVTITEKGTRNQLTAYVSAVITERVFELYAIVLLASTRAAIDDIPQSVGGGAKTSSVEE